MKRILLTSTFVLALTACGSSGMHSGLGNADAATLDQAASAASTTVAAYAASASTVSTSSACTGSAQQYAAEMKPAVDQVMGVAGRMDGAFSGMGRAGHADVQCTAMAMSTELAGYMAVACGLPDMAANQAEMSRHLATMQDYATHMRMRAAELDGSTGSGMGGGMGGGMGSGMGSGWTMPGGGVMSWDHHVGACAGGTTGTTGPTGPTGPTGLPFADPPVAPATRSGNVVDVTIEASQASASLGGTSAQVLAYDGSFVAPVVQARKGDILRIHFKNSLPAGAGLNVLGHPRFDTNLHVHGLHVTPGANPDGVAGDDVFRSVAPGGGLLDYEHDLSRQPAGSMAFYHPHMHGSVAEQIWGGLIGPIDVADAAGSPLAAYETHVMVLKDITLAGGAPSPYATMMDYAMGKEGNLVLVNGQSNPTLPIRPGQVQRWRIYNASTARFYRLSLEGHLLQVVGTDGGPLDKPYAMTEVLLSPAERVDVLVQGSATPGSFRLLALPYDRGGMGMMGGATGMGMMAFGGAASAQVPLLTLVDAGSPATDAMPSRVDPSATRIAMDLASLPHTRFVLGMMMGRASINGISFSEAADGTVTSYQHDSKVGTYEVWEIVNQTGMDHPWHQHVNSAQVVAVNGIDPATGPYADLYTNAPAMKDTVIVPKGGSVTLLVPVLDYAGKTVFHCHVVEHEDIGMMGIWNIVP